MPRFPKSPAEPCVAFQLSLYPSDRAALEGIISYLQTHTILPGKVTAASAIRWSLCQTLQAIRRTLYDQITSPKTSPDDPE